MAKIPNASYWSKRMDAMQQAALDKGEGYMENLEKQFELATASLDRDVSLWYQRFAENNEITYAEAKKRLSAGELKEFKWTVEEYIKHAEENELSGQWIKELENASARIHISRLDALKLQLQQQAEVLHGKQGSGLNGLFSGIYADGYYTTAFELQKGIGMGWAMQSLNPRLVEQVLSRPWTEDNNTFSGRIWTHKQELINSLNTHITQMVIRGDPPKKAIALLAQDMRVAKNKAARLVMTEAAAFASAAQKDCFRELGVERYQIIATRDSSTSQTCRDMDSKIFDIADYQVGLTAPPFHPFCRTVTAPFYEDMEKLVDRASKDDVTGRTFTPIPRTMTAQEWRDQFMDVDEQYTIIQRRKELYREAEEKGKMPHAEQSTIKRSKLENYILDPHHILGQHKARVIKAATGYDQSSWEEFRDKVLNEVTRSPLREVTPFSYIEEGVEINSTKYLVRILVTGRDGGFLEMDVVWAVDEGTTAPRFVTGKF